VPIGFVAAIVMVMGALLPPSSAGHELQWWMSIIAMGSFPILVFVALTAGWTGFRFGSYASAVYWQLLPLPFFLLITFELGRELV